MAEKLHLQFKNLQLACTYANIKSCFSSHLDSKIYLIISLISLVLLFYSIWEIKYVVVDVKDFLGLISHLSLAYWIGYVLMVLFSIRLYLDKRIKNDIIYLIYLIVIGLFLFGVPIFAEENARFPWSYYPAGEVKTVLETKYVDTKSNYPLITYRSWPATHFISSAILYFTDIKIETLLKYVPLFWVLSVILIIFSIGKRLKLLSNQSFLASFLFLASFFSPHYYYSPVSFAYLLYLLLFMFIVAYSTINLKASSAESQKDENINFIKGKISTTILISLIFISLVITHILTAIAVISSFIFSSLFIRTLHNKRIKFIMFFLILFIAWYVFFAPIMFENGVKELLRVVTQLDALNIFKTGKYSVPFAANTTRWVVHYSRFFFIVVYAIAMMVASAFYINGRIKREKIESTKICFFWLFGILALFGLKYGGEIDDRIYLFSLVPMVFIMAFTFDRKILAIMAILLVILHMPAHYGTESFDLVRTTELNGAKFFAANSVFDNRETYFSMWDTFINYYDPEKVKTFWNTLFVVEKPDQSKIDNSTYIINSDGSHNFLFYSFGFDPLKEWILLNQGKLSLFYDNGHYQIYKNKQ